MEYTILILLLPLLSFLFLGLAGMKLKPVVAGAIGTAVLAVVALLSYCTAFEYFSAGRDAAGMFPTLVPWNTVWLPISRTLHIDLGILLDPISVMMLVVISTVSLMVHVYSLGYMKGERGFQRYYAFLSLFTMSMMGLVVATNIFQMYLFWELVGVSSYLLIGFYYTKKEAVAASKKAFIVTRFADLGFLVGILFYGYYAGTFSFTPDVQLLAAAGAMIPLALGLIFMPRRWSWRASTSWRACSRSLSAMRPRCCTGRPISGPLRRCTPPSWPACRATSSVCWRSVPFRRSAS